MSSAPLFTECGGELDRGHLDAAQQCCSQHLDSTSDDGGAWLLCGVADSRAGHPDQAVDKLRQALRLDASEAAWETYLGLRSGLRTDRHAKALELEQAGASAEAAALLEQDAPRDAEALCQIGRLYLHAGRLDAAQDRFERAASGPDPPPCALRGLGLVALARGHTEEASALSQRLHEMGEPPLPLPQPGLAGPDPVDDLSKASCVTRAELGLLLVRLGPSAARSGPAPARALLDLAGHPLKNAAAEALARGWMRTVRDGFFEPDRIVDRLELGVTLAALLPEPPHCPAAPGTAAPWHKAFPELGPLWGCAPFRHLAQPRDLLQPATGAETVDLLLSLWRRAMRADASSASGTP